MACENISVVKEKILPLSLFFSTLMQAVCMHRMHPRYTQTKYFDNIRKVYISVSYSHSEVTRRLIDYRVNVTIIIEDDDSVLCI